MHRRGGARRSSKPQRLDLCLNLLAAGRPEVAQVRVPHRQPVGFFAFAHLAFCAAAILARPSALTFRRFVTRGNPRSSGAV